MSPVHNANKFDDVYKNTIKEEDYSHDNQPIEPLITFKKKEKVNRIRSSSSDSIKEKNQKKKNGNKICPEPVGQSIISQSIDLSSTIIEAKPNNVDAADQVSKKLID